MLPSISASIEERGRCAIPRHAGFDLKIATGRPGKGPTKSEAAAALSLLRELGAS